jgi:hypothetical protein
VTDKTDSGLPRLTDAQRSRIVFIIGGVRSGTTVFRRMMASHSLIRDRGEIFNANNPAGYFKFLREQVARDPNLIFPERSVDVFHAYLVSLMPKEPDAQALVDVKYEHLTLLPEAWQMPFSNPPLLRIIHRTKAKVLHLRRQHFYSAVSNLVAINTGRYHDRVGESGALPEKRAVTVDRDLLLGQIKKRRRVADLVDASLKGDLCLGLDYEALFEGHGDFSAAKCQQVADFLGLAQTFDRKPALRKVIDEPLSSVIANYAEIADLEAEPA